MVPVTVDQTLSETLVTLGEPAELHDPAGHVLGYFTPMATSEDYAAVEIPYSDEQLKSMKEEAIEQARRGETFSTSDVVSRLRNIAK